MSNRPTEARFARDQRGAILVVGVIMGVCLVAALSYAVAVGNAILQQERLQVAADATAFQTAIWHARGMNLLALLNMVVAALMMVFVAFRVIEIAIVVVLVVCMAMTGGLCAAVSPSTLTSVIRAEMRITRPVMTVAKTLTVAEEAVAIAVPYIATGPGLAKTVDFYRQRGATSHNAYSLSMLPTSIDAFVLKFAVPGVNPRAGYRGAYIAPFVSVVQHMVRNPDASVELIFGDHVEGLSRLVAADLSELGASLAHGFPSLPVEDDTQASMCGRTGEIMATSLSSGMGGSGPLSIATTAVQSIELLGPDILPDGVYETIDQGNQFFRTAVGYGFSLGPVAFIMCQPLTAIVSSAISKVVDMLPTPLQAVMHLPPARGGVEELRRIVAEKVSGAAPGTSLEDALATPGERGGFAGAVDGGITRGLQLRTRRAKVRATKLWSLTQNGRVVQRTWASVGTTSQSRWAFARDIRPGAGQAVASAEYYAVCYDYPDGFLPSIDVLERSCEDDAMWRIGWTARMRRVRAIHEEAALEVEGFVRSLLAQAVQGAVPFGSIVPVQNLIDMVFSDPSSPVSNGIDRAFDLATDNPVSNWLEDQIADRLGLHGSEDIIH